MRIGWRTDSPPKEEDDYLVQYDSGSMDICWWTDAHLFWHGRKTIWHWRARQFCEVVAWMPLPDPYVPKREGDEEVGIDGEMR